MIRFTSLMTLFSLLFLATTSAPGIGPKGGKDGNRPNAGGGGPGVSNAKAGIPNIGSGGDRARQASPAVRPNISKPGSSISPPSIPKTSRPTVGAGNSGGRPNPGIPNLGGTGSKPNSGRSDFSGGNSRPSLGGASRPNLPGGTGSSRPDLGDKNRPGNRPQIGDMNRPTRPGGSNPAVDIRPNQPVNRPKPGDFLGLDRPTTLPGNRPSTGFPTTLPGNPVNKLPPGFRPGGGDRPGGGRPGDGGRPGFPDRERPGQGDNNRPGSGGNNRPGNRPWDPGQRPVGGWNNSIHNRPGWANIDNSTNINIHNNWQTIINNNYQNGRWDRPSNNRWNSWANNVNHHWDHYHDHHRWYDRNWWDSHYHAYGGWHYYNNFSSRPWSYWWTVPAWGTLNNWFYWSNTGAAYTQPIYYDYGQGGNIYYQGNTVYMSGQPIATTTDFAASAAQLATVAPPNTQTEADAAEWMPLGTFAVSSGELDVNPSRVLQLAVNKSGIVSGTLYNYDTDEAQSVLGQVDKDTQRVAFRLGDSETVIETGLYNLTQEQTPVLVHYGPNRYETWLLVRLQNPDAGR